MEVITACDLQKAYPGGVRGLAGINVQINNGEMVGILGPSGSGKTTFFRLINGALIPTGGTLKVLGKEMGSLPRRELRQLRSHIAMVYQNHNVVPGMSVANNVLMGKLGSLGLGKCLVELFGLSAGQEAQITSLLEQLGIADKIHLRAGDLSGGQQQRVAVARALIAKPEIILADEPIASVDMKTAELILNLFQELHKAGKTVILNLHQIDFALHYCTRLLAFNGGRIIYDGKPEEFIKSRVYMDKFATAMGGETVAG